MNSNEPSVAEKSISKSGDRALVSVNDLLTEQLIQRDETEQLSEVVKEFKVRITPEMRKAIQSNPDASSGITKQFVPTAEELSIRNEELYDPIGDEIYSPVKGLTHRYPDRVVMVSTHICEVYCRFCFRRETVGDSGHMTDNDFDDAIRYIESTPQIWEVILTGGDPLVLAPRRLAVIMQRLSKIEHVEVVRFHTRVPVVAPQKITDDLIAALKVRPSVFLVVHTNHVSEITENAQQAFSKLVDNGIPLLAQTVLLNGVNDSSEELSALFRCLIRHRVKPYYLHHTDLARGTSHFRTTVEKGQRIMAEMRGNLSGICLPTFVLDIPGGFGKVPIGPTYLQPTGKAGEYTVEDYRGGKHEYRDISAKDA